LTCPKSRDNELFLFSNEYQGQPVRANQPAAVAAAALELIHEIKRCCAECARGDNCKKKNARGEKKFTAAFSGPKRAGWLLEARAHFHPAFEQWKKV